MSIILYWYWYIVDNYRTLLFYHRCKHDTTDVLSSTLLNVAFPCLSRKTKSSIFETVELGLC